MVIDESSASSAMRSPTREEEEESGGKSVEDSLPPPGSVPPDGDPSDPAPPAPPAPPVPLVPPPASKMSPPALPREGEEEDSRPKEPLYSEDIVEGFAFLSFESFEDLQKVTQWSELHNGKLPDPFSVIQFEKEEKKPKKKKRKRDPGSGNNGSHPKDLDNLVEANGDKGSTGSNSEKGYLCDSESDEEKGSENGVEELLGSRKTSSSCHANGVGNNNHSTSSPPSSAALPTVTTAAASAVVISSSPPTAIVTPSVIVTTVPSSSSSNTTVTSSSATAAAPSKSFFRPYSISPPPRSATSSITNSSKGAQCKQEVEEDSPLVVHHHHPAYRPSGGNTPYIPPPPPSYPQQQQQAANKRPYDYSQFIPPSAQSPYYPPSQFPHHHYPHYNLPHPPTGNPKEEYGPDAKRVAYSTSSFGPQSYPNKVPPSQPHYPPNYSKNHHHSLYSSGHKGPVPASSVPSSTSISIHSASSLRENPSWNNNSSRSGVRSTSSTSSSSMAPMSGKSPGGGITTHSSTSSMNSRIRHELDSRYYPGSSPYLMHPRSDILMGGGPSRPTVPPPASYLPDSMLKDVPKVGEDPFNSYQRSSSAVGKAGAPHYNAPLRPSLSSVSAGGLPTTTSFTTPSDQGSSVPKKSGKWNAMHVRIAWEIYNHQQKHMPDNKQGSTAGLIPTSVTATNPSLSSKVAVESALKTKAPSIQQQHYLPSPSGEHAKPVASRQDMMLHHSNKAATESSTRLPNPAGHHLMNPFNLRPPLGVASSLFGAPPLDVLNPYARFGGPSSAPPPSPFGGLGLRPGMWPLKSSESSLLLPERKRRSQDSASKQSAYVRESSRSPTIIRSSSLSGSPSGRSNASPLVPSAGNSKKEELSRPGSSSSLKQDDVILLDPPEGGGSGRNSLNNNNSRTTPNNIISNNSSSNSNNLHHLQHHHHHNSSSSSSHSHNSSSSSTRHPSVSRSRPHSSRTPAPPNPYGQNMFPSSSSVGGTPAASPNSHHHHHHHPPHPLSSLYGLHPSQQPPHSFDPYKSLQQHMAPPTHYHPHHPQQQQQQQQHYSQKDPAVASRERAAELLLRQNPLGSLILSEQERARLAGLPYSGGYLPPQPGHPPAPPSMNPASALKGAPQPSPHHLLGMYHPGYTGLPPSLNGAHGSSAGAAPYK